MKGRYIKSMRNIMNCNILCTLMYRIVIAAALQWEIDVPVSCVNNLITLREGTLNTLMDIFKDILHSL